MRSVIIDIDFAGVSTSTSAAATGTATTPSSTTTATQTSSSLVVASISGSVPFYLIGSIHHSLDCTLKGISLISGFCMLSLVNGSNVSQLFGKLV